MKYNVKKINIHTYKYTDEAGKAVFEVPIQSENFKFVGSYVSEGA